MRHGTSTINEVDKVQQVIDLQVQLCFVHCFASLSGSILIFFPLVSFFGSVVYTDFQLISCFNMNTDLQANPIQKIHEEVQRSMVGLLVPFDSSGTDFD